MKKIALQIILLFAVCCALYAQENGKVSIGNVQVIQQEKQITITYDLEFGAGVNSCKINLFLSTDGGRSFGAKALSNGVSGDIGKIMTGGRKTIVYNVGEKASSLNGMPISFKVEVASYDIDRSLRYQNRYSASPTANQGKESSRKTVGKVLLAPVVSISSTTSFGLMAGYMGKVGGYAKYISNFKSANFAYECTSDGNIPGGLIWASGNSSAPKMNVTVGALFSVAEPIVLYAGAGYMNKTVLWEDSSENNVKVTDASFSGACLDAGAIFKFGMVGINCGICVPVSFKSLDFNVGLSLFF